MKENSIGKVKHFIKKIFGNLIPEKKLFPSYVFFVRASRKNLMKRKSLRFEVHLTEHCNLNCKYCSHYSSLAEKEFLDIKSFERDLARISELTKREVGWIHLLGGEPLLHPQIIEFLNLPGKYFDTGKVIIYTNGTLLLKQPGAFWESCKQNKVEIRISYYPIKLDRPVISTVAKKYGVSIRYMGGGIKTMFKVPLDLSGSQDAKDSFLRCFQVNNCVYLEKGKIYPCPGIPNIRHFNRYFNQNIQISENDYIDIYKVKNVDGIFDFLRKPVPFCRYCNRKGIVYGLKWDITKKEISEWT